jgi:hypothetical protein
VYERLTEMLYRFKPPANWSHYHLEKWFRLADEGVGEDRVVQLLEQGHANGKRLAQILMLGWAEVTVQAQAEAKRMAAEKSRRDVIDEARTLYESERMGRGEQ